MFDHTFDDRGGGLVTDNPMSPSPSPLPPAGWYPDPDVPQNLRYWDGSTWTDHSQPSPTEAPVFMRTEAHIPVVAQPLAVSPGEPTMATSAPVTVARVGPLEACKLAIIRIGDYRGRSSRSEFWWDQLIFTLLYVAITLLTSYYYVILGLPRPPEGGGASGLANLVYVLSQLALWAVTLPLTIRRLHDTGKPWPWLLMLIVPLGPLVLLFFWCQPTELEENKWGPPPRLS